MNTIAVVTDTGTNMTMDEAKQYGIICFPLQIEMGEHTYRDLIDISTQEIYDQIKQGILGKTSMPAYELMYDTFQDLKKQGYTDILVCTLTSGLSTTSEVMQTIGREIDIQVHVVDMYSTCQIQKYVAIKAKQLVDKGKNIDEILSILNAAIQKSESVILIKDLNHLKEGGRLTPMAASLANLLKIFPILHIGPMTKGRIDVLNKVRTEKRAMKWTMDYMYDNVDKENMEFFLLSTEDPQMIEAFNESLTVHNVPKENIHIDVISSVIAIHTGMHCYATQWIPKIDI